MAHTAICCISSCRRSPISVTDEYGGSRENRMRFPLEIVFDRARRVSGRQTGRRASVGTDWVEGGWSLDDTIAFAQELKKRGCDWIDVSSGGVSPLQKIPLEPGYQVPFARTVKEATGLPRSQWVSSPIRCTPSK
jgi:2,4-dienoyl-CoA reductase-like NADH-dependent reductase (Old Yellow Enzyme family)